MRFAWIAAFVTGAAIAPFSVDAAVGAAQPLAEQARSIAPGHWAPVAVDNRAGDVDPAASPATNPAHPGRPSWGGNIGFRGIWEAWNSGVYAPDSGRCGALLYFGGGHNDYWGNEVVALDLCGGAAGGPLWKRLSDPYGGPIEWPRPEGGFPDGTPVPPHTYDLLSFDPGGRALVLLKSLASGPRPAYSPHAWVFDLDRARWRGPYAHRGAQYGASAWDSRRKRVWFQPQQGLAGELTAFDPATGRFEYFGWPYVHGVGNLDSMMGYDAGNDRLVLTSFRGASRTVAEHDLDDPDGPWRVAVQRDAPAALMGQHALSWSALRGAWIVWMSGGGGAVHELRRTGETADGAAEYTWSRLTAPDNAVVPIATGVPHNGSYGKFRVVPVADGAELLMGQLRLADGVFAFRLPPTTGSAPARTVPDVTRSAAAPAAAAPVPAAVPVAGAALPRSLCARPGVFVCEDFAEGSDLTGTLHAGNDVPVLEAGHLRFRIPSPSGADAGGHYRLSFPPVAEGDFLAFAYRVKADEAALALPGRKEFVLWRGASSCTDLELAQTHFYDTRVIMPYTACGSGHFLLPRPPHDYQWHYPDYDCTYHGLRKSHAGCVASRPDVWEAYYVELTVGRYGQADSSVVMWHRGEGEPWRRYVDRDDFVFRGSGGFDHFMLTVYMTGKDPAATHASGEVRFDHLVMSTRPFGEALGVPVRRGGE